MRFTLVVKSTSTVAGDHFSEMGSDCKTCAQDMADAINDSPNMRVVSVYREHEWEGETKRQNVSRHVNFADMIGKEK